MKKSTITLTLCAALLATCTLAFASCIQTDNKTLNGIYLAQGEQRLNESLGDFVYGTSLSEILPQGEIDVVAEYSDGSSKTLSESDYTVTYEYVKDDATETIGAFPEQPEVGEYRATYAYETVTAQLMFAIVRGEADVTLSLGVQAWTFSDVPASPAIGGYEGDAESVDFYYVPQSVYDALTEEQKAEYWRQPSVTEAEQFYVESYGSILPGEYYLYAYYGETESYASGYTPITGQTAFSVSKAVIDLSAFDLTGWGASYRYVTGEDAVIGDITLGDIAINVMGDPIVDANGTQIYGSLVWAEPETAVNASDDGESFPVRFALGQSVAEAYEITGGGAVAVTIEQGVAARAVIQLPASYIPGTGPYPDTAHDYVLANGKSYPVVIDGWNERCVQVTISKDGGAPQAIVPTERYDEVYGDFRFFLPELSEAGTYLYTVALTDSVNYRWEGETGDSAPFTYTCEVKPLIAVEKPVLKLYGSLTDENGRDYLIDDGKQHNAIVVVNYTEEIGNYAAYTLVSGGEQSLGVPMSAELGGEQVYALFASPAFTVGEYEIEISLRQGAGQEAYYWAGTEEDMDPLVYTFAILPSYGLFEIGSDDSYTKFDPTETEDTIFYQFMDAWNNQETGFATMLDYTAEYYFYQDLNGEIAEYVGTVHNEYGSKEEMQFISGGPYRFETELSLTCRKDGLEREYSGGGTVSSVEQECTASLTDADGTPVGTYSELAPLFTGSAIDLPWTLMQSEDISYWTRTAEYVEVKVVCVLEDESGTTEQMSVFCFDGTDGAFVGHYYRSVHEAADGSRSEHMGQLKIKAEA